MASRNPQLTKKILMKYRGYSEDPSPKSSKKMLSENEVVKESIDKGILLKAKDSLINIKDTNYHLYEHINQAYMLLDTIIKNMK